MCMFCIVFNVWDLNLWKALRWPCAVDWAITPSINKSIHNVSDLPSTLQEAFDYIGSSRMLYEMQHGRFPVDSTDKSGRHLQKINLKHIDQFVELSQVGFRGPANSLWLHADPDVRKKTNVRVDFVCVGGGVILGGIWPFPPEVSHIATWSLFGYSQFHKGGVPCVDFGFSTKSVVSIHLCSWNVSTECYLKMFD